MQHPLREVAPDGFGARPGIAVACSAELASRHRHHRRHGSIGGRSADGRNIQLTSMVAYLAPGVAVTFE